MKTHTSQTNAPHDAPFTSSAGKTSRTTRNAALLLFSVALQLAGGTAAVRGQSALDGFDPNANNTVRVSVVQPDGKTLIGGSFTSVLGVTRNRIARLNPDGTLDTTFDPNGNNEVDSIALQPDGKILVGGNFTSIGGQVRSKIARLDPVTGLADSWDPNANNIVYAIAVQTDGKILAGGLFFGANSIGGQARSRIARLDPVTGLADSFDPSANSTVTSIVLQADGKILVGGGFNGANSIGGQLRNNIARLDPVTGLADSWNPNANAAVFSDFPIAVQADGKILVGGNFSTIGGQSRNRIVRLDPVTGLADSWNPNADNLVLSIVVQADGKILAGGFFLNIGGQSRNRIARLDAVTGLADSFDPNANNVVYAVAVQPDGKVLAGGSFTSLSPNGGVAVTRNSIARLETNGRLDQTLNLSTVGTYVAATAVQPDGKILIGGSFTTVLGVARNNIARLNTDGTLDTAFDPNANGPQVYAIAVQADGKILAGGGFGSIGGQTRNNIARLDAVTGLADSWNPNASNAVASIAVQADGKILAGGLFTSIGGQTRNRIARLDATTGLADSFDPNAINAVFSIVVQADGKILAGGAFNVIGGQTRNRIARLNATTGLADSFDPNANSSVQAIAVQADGKILAGGDFTNIGGQPRSRIARLDATTGLADSFDPAANGTVYSIVVQADGKILAGGVFSPGGGGISIGGQVRGHIARLDATTGLADSFDPNANGANVYSIAVRADGKVLVGGDFTNIGGQTRSLFARLSNDTAALQNLSVTPTAVTWTRGGASPLLTRVTFESSTDNVTYTPLGNGTASGSNWTLTGLSFPTNQNFYIRARGYYHSSFLNGSESLTESVRNAFFAPPVITSANNTTFTVGTAGAFSVTTTGIPTGTSMVITKTGALPGGVTFVDNNNGTATLAGTPNPGTGGSYPITITASNGVSPNATQNFTLAVNEAPRISSANSTTFTVGAAGTFNVATDRGFPIPALNESGALPGGVTFVDNGNGTATLAANPTAGSGGVYALTITASNGVSPNATQSFTLTVNEAPLITSANNATFIAGSAGTFTVTTGHSFPANPALSKTGALPGVVTFTDNGNGTATIAGTPSPGTGGTYSLTITANNGVSPNGTQSFTLTVNEAPLITSANNATFIAGSARTFTVTTGHSFPANPALSKTGALPGGVTFTDNGNGTATIAGTAVAGTGGVYSLTITANNGIPPNGTQTFTLAVNEAQIVSRKLHNGTPFDINLPLTGPGIECRSGGATNDYQVVFTFGNSVTFNNASVSAGSVSSTSGSGTATVTVNLTGITSAQTITVTLLGVNNGGDLPVQMGVLVGDTNGDGHVDASDIGQTKANSGQAVNASNFRTDVNVNGAINASDIGLVKSKTGTGLL